MCYEFIIQLQKLEYIKSITYEIIMQENQI